MIYLCQSTRRRCYTEIWTENGPLVEIERKRKQKIQEIKNGMHCRLVGLFHFCEAAILVIESRFTFSTTF